MSQGLNLSESQFLETMEEAIPTPEINYEEIVESHKKDQLTTNLIGQRLQILCEIKENKEQELKSIKKISQEFGTECEMIKNKIVEDTMHVYDWNRIACDNAQSEATINLLKQLQEKELKLYKDHALRFEDLNRKYNSLKDLNEPARLQNILNNLRKTEAEYDIKIQQAETKLKELQIVKPKLNSVVNLSPLEEKCKEFAQQSSAQNERIKLLKDQHVKDQAFINLLKAEIDQYEQNV